jgi:hypothetical protein
MPSNADLSNYFHKLLRALGRSNPQAIYFNHFPAIWLSNSALLADQRQVIGCHPPLCPTSFFRSSSTAILSRVLLKHSVFLSESISKNGIQHDPLHQSMRVIKFLIILLRRSIKGDLVGDLRSEYQSPR